MGSQHSLEGASHRGLGKESLPQLCALIDSVIAGHPGLIDTDSFLSREERVAQVKEAMRKKGFRPITAEEYKEQLFLASQCGIHSQINLWYPLDPDARINEPDSFSFDDGGIRTPTSTASQEELHLTIGASLMTSDSLPTDDWLGKMRDSRSSACSSDNERLLTSISELDTVEWPTISARSVPSKHA